MSQIALACPILRLLVALLTSMLQPGNVAPGACFDGLWPVHLEASSVP